MTKNTGLYGNTLTFMISERKLAGLTQSKMADRLGMDRRKYMRLENGEGYVADLFLALEALGIDLIAFVKNRSSSQPGGLK